jgi:hypothetical protein
MCYRIFGRRRGLRVSELALGNRQLRARADKQASRDRFGRVWRAVALLFRRHFHGGLNAMNSFNGISGSTLSPRCLADSIPFTGPAGWFWWLRGVRRSPSNPNLCNR